jgi:HEPN domain-containing protein
MKDEVKNWIDSARYDFETAENLFTSGRYIYTVFMCHLSLEKMIKAKIEEISGKAPPRSHDLEYLMSIAGLSP